MMILTHTHFFETPFHPESFAVSYSSGNNCFWVCVCLWNERKILGPKWEESICRVFIFGVLALTLPQSPVWTYTHTHTAANQHNLREEWAQRDRSLISRHNRADRGNRQGRKDRPSPWHTHTHTVVAECFLLWVCGWTLFFGGHSEFTLPCHIYRYISYKDTL